MDIFSEQIVIEDAFSYVSSEYIIDYVDYSVFQAFVLWFLCLV